MPVAGGPGQVPSVLLSTQVGVECPRGPVRSKIQSFLMWQERLEKHRSEKLLVPWISAVTPALSHSGLALAGGGCRTPSLSIDCRELEERSSAGANVGPSEPAAPMARLCTDLALNTEQQFGNWFKQRYRNDCAGRH